MPNLIVKNVSVSAGNKTVVSDVSFEIASGEIHVLQGANGSGKSSLAFALAGHPHYKIIKGDVCIGRKSLKKMKAQERAQAGLFLSFQEAPEVGGVQMGLFLKNLISQKEENKKKRVIAIQALKELAIKLGTKEDFLSRFLNKDFSGGEKRKSEILQLLALKPKFAILDEVDSGLDSESMKVVATVLKDLVKGEGMGLLLISHGSKMVDMLEPDKKYIMKDGKIMS